MLFIDPPGETLLFLPLLRSGEEGGDVGESASLPAIPGDAEPILLLSSEEG